MTTRRRNGGVVESYLAALALGAILLGCSTAQPTPRPAVTLFIENDSAIAVAVSIDGSKVGDAPSGFRGPLTSISQSSPRALSLTTAVGVHLADWAISGSAAFEWAPDPACGNVTLWLDTTSPSFGPIGTPDASACP